jgi:hypothetical protein
MGGKALGSSVILNKGAIGSCFHYPRYVRPRLVARDQLPQSPILLFLDFYFFKSTFK